MHLVSQVVLEYNIPAVFPVAIFCQSSKFNTLDELQNIIKNEKKEKPYRINVRRFFQIIDTDPNEHTDIEKTKKPVVHQISEECVSVIVADKLTYPNDIRKMLKEKYGRALDFDKHPNLDENTPVFFRGVQERRFTGLKVGQHSTHYTFHDVIYDVLNPKCDIVVNEKLNQIWPVKTNKMPVALVELVNRPKEKVYER